MTVVVSTALVGALVPQSVLVAVNGVGPRTNQFANPSFETNTTGWAAVRATIARTASGSAFSGANVLRVTNDATASTHYVTTNPRANVVAGQTITVSTYARLVSGSGVGYAVKLTFWNAAVAVVGSAVQGVPANLTTGAWSRPFVTSVVPATAVTVTVDITVGTDGTGDVWEMDAALLEESASLDTYIDTTLTTRNVHVYGTTATGFEWSLPGGTLTTTTPDQVVLIDTRAPLNQELTYIAVVDGIATSSQTITVPSVSEFVIQALDGRSLVAPDSLLDGDFTLAPLVRATTFDVPGRRRPLVRYDVSGDGGSAFSLLCNVDQSRALWELLRSGAPLVYRSAQIRDIPSSAIVHVASASSTSNQDDASRVWALDFLYLDDPDPSVVPVVRTWDMFDAAYAGSTWDAFDMEWAGQTWNDFDVEDWSQR